MDAHVKYDDDPGLTSLVVIARLHGIAADAAQLRHQAACASRFSSTDLLIAAKSLGLKARLVAARLDRLNHLPLPALFLDTEDRHFVVVRAQGSQVLLQEGSASAPRVVTLRELEQRYS